MSETDVSLSSGASAQMKQLFQHLPSGTLLIHRQARMPVPTGSPGGTPRAEARGNKLSGVELV